MKLPQEDIKELLNYVSLADDFKPVFKEILKILESYGSELNVVIKNISKTLADNKIEIIRYYQDAGFTKEEAILLTINSGHALTKTLSNININR